MKVKTQENWYLRSLSLLLLGALLIFFADMRGGAGVLAWIAPVPFLLYVVYYRGRRDHMWLFLALQIAANLMLMKIITPPLPYTMAFMFGIPTGAILFFVYSLWGWIRELSGDAWSSLAYVSIVVLVEWLQAQYGPMGVWGTIAHSQLRNLPLLQTAALFGHLGISALIAWAAVLIALVIKAQSFSRWKYQLAAFALVFVALNVYGNLRLLSVSPGEQIRAAAIFSDLQVSGELPQADSPEVQQTTREQFELTRKAAGMGAELVVWNEGATFISRGNEAAFLGELSELAHTAGTAIVAAYAVPLEDAGNRQDGAEFENKYVWFLPDGTLAQTYFKHQPVPGEGALKGREEIEAIPTPKGLMSGAICYDYDFPKISRTHSRLGVDLVALPSSDWRGIDSQHTLMTRLRAIEGGFSLIRSVRGASSMGFDQYGRIRGSMSFFEENDRILMISMPLARVETLYSKTGDILPYMAILSLILILLRSRKAVKTESRE